MSCLFLESGSPPDTSRLQLGTRKGGLTCFGAVRVAMSPAGSRLICEVVTDRWQKWTDLEVSEAAGRMHGMRVSCWAAE